MFLDIFRTIGSTLNNSWKYYNTYLQILKLINDMHNKSDIIHNFFRYVSARLCNNIARYYILTPRRRKQWKEVCYAFFDFCVSTKIMNACGSLMHQKLIRSLYSLFHWQKHFPLTLLIILKILPFTSQRHLKI